MFVLTALTGYFVAQEFSFVAVDRGELRRQARAGDRRAARALAVTGRVSFMLSGAQLGITVTGLIVGFLAEPAVAALVRPVLPALGIPDSASTGVSVTVGLVLATVVQMVLGELLPKNYGIARPEPVAKALAGSTLLYLRIAGPVIRLFDRSASRLLRLVGVEPVEELHEGAGPEELERIIDESEESGDLPPRLAGLLERAMDFDERIADDVMVPRARVTAVRADATARQALRTLQEAGVTRCPVFAVGGVDDVVGLLSVRELIADPDLDFDTATAGALARPALLVPDTLPVPVLLGRMRAEDAEMACVIDEFGGLDGVVTVEDIAEELVGEIEDESDEPEEQSVRAADGSWLLDGALRLDEVERICGLELPEGEYETLGGLVMTRLGRLPQIGDAVELVLVPPAPLEGEPPPPLHVRLAVEGIERRVPAEVRLTVRQQDGGAVGGEAS
ncbi:hypothetical protein BIV57_22040 [Mangrovactinospora gilvigrisea]|uniref:HlyC/CorC family transporter n=1 Tax=Mangrovactinospora gilvigrisea TaxID=1428644 RepID=A0A1J7BPI9_9ACTN|nr:hypothetical protein BIV57_22040 [Mangrovactinospora gilvigrisea]